MDQWPMKDAAYIHAASTEVNNLTREIDMIIDRYLAQSEMPKYQRVVNVGRALNALHVAWTANLTTELDRRNEIIISSGLRSIPALQRVAKELNPEKEEQ